MKRHRHVFAKQRMSENQRLDWELGSRVAGDLLAENTGVIGRVVVENRGRLALAVEEAAEVSTFTLYNEYFGIKGDPDRVLLGTSHFSKDDWMSAEQVWPELPKDQRTIIIHFVDVRPFYPGMPGYDEKNTDYELS